MRALADAERIHALMRALARAAREPASIYFTGGTTAVLMGWRGTTVDVDLRIEPGGDELLRALGDLKERLDINVELASPEDFVPVPAGWRERSPFIGREGPISFHHFDLHAQALSKAERSHEQDVADVRSMLDLGVVSAESLWRYYGKAVADLHRYPAIDQGALERSLEALLGPEP